MKKSKAVTTVRLTEEAKTLLRQLSEEMGISQTAVMELAIRKMAKELGNKGSKK